MGLRVHTGGGGDNKGCKLCTCRARGWCVLRICAVVLDLHTRRLRSITSFQRQHPYSLFLSLFSVGVPVGLCKIDVRSVFWKRIFAKTLKVKYKKTTWYATETLMSL